jgi:uncharacterized membrane protein YkvA (DUF1232 family)
MPYSGTQMAGSSSKGWGRAYVRFLLSRDENLLLKIAPLALIGILPVDIISNVVPFVGEIDDIGFVVALLFVAGRTLHRVNKYR